MGSKLVRIERGALYVGQTRLVPSLVILALAAWIPALHMCFELIEREQTPLGYWGNVAMAILSALAFLAIELGSIHSLAAGANAGQKIAGAATYTVLMVSSGIIQTAYYSQTDTLFLNEGLGWWIVAAIVGMAAQAGFNLAAQSQETAQQRQRDQEQQERLLAAARQERLALEEIRVAAQVKVEQARIAEQGKLERQRLKAETPQLPAPAAPPAGSDSGATHDATETTQARQTTETTQAGAKGATEPIDLAALAPLSSPAVAGLAVQRGVSLRTMQRHLGQAGLVYDGTYWVTNPQTQVNGHGQGVSNG